MATVSPTLVAGGPAGVSEFGYAAELHRSIGTYASFAAGFSFVSILTTVF